MATLRNLDCPLSCASLEEAGVVWFTGWGFRPAVWTPPHRDDGVDPDRLVPAPDAGAPYLAKYDGPLADGATGYFWGTWTPADAVLSAPQITAAELARFGAGQVPVYSSAPTQPWWPSWPDGPDYPCHCVEVPPVNPPMPAPVPIEAGTGSLLLVALGALLALRMRRKP